MRAKTLSRIDLLENELSVSVVEKNVVAAEERVAEDSVELWYVAHGRDANGLRDICRIGQPIS